MQPTTDPRYGCSVLRNRVSGSYCCRLLFCFVYLLSRGCCYVASGCCYVTSGRCWLLLCLLYQTILSSNADTTTLSLSVLIATYASELPSLFRSVFIAACVSLPITCALCSCVCASRCVRETLCLTVCVCRVVRVV